MSQIAEPCHIEVSLKIPIFRLWRARS